MKYIIRKVPERDTSYLEQLISGAKIYNDADHYGAVHSFIEAIKMADDDAVYVQDDMILCPDFCVRAESYISSHPDAVIAFSYTANTKCGLKEGFYRMLGGGFLLCTYIPKAIGNAFVEWYERREWKALKIPAAYFNQQLDDCFFGLYLDKIGKDVFLAIPNLAGHPRNKSVIDQNRPERICAYFEYKSSK